MTGTEIALLVGIAIIYLFGALTTYHVLKPKMEQYFEDPAVIGAVVWPIVVAGTLVIFIVKKMFVPPAQKLADWIT